MPRLTCGVLAKGAAFQKSACAEIPSPVVAQESCCFLGPCWKADYRSVFMSFCLGLLCFVLV